MSCEITTIIKDDEKRLSTKYMIYDNETWNSLPVTASINDKTVQECINKSMVNFNSENQDIDIKVKIELVV